MTHLACECLCIGIIHSLFETLLIDPTPFFNPLHQTLRMDVFGRACAVTHRQEGVGVIDSLTVTEATGRIGLEHGGLCLFWVEGAGEHALSLWNFGLFYLLVVVLRARWLPEYSQNVNCSLTQPYLVALFHPVPTLFLRNYQTQWLSVSLPT